MGAISGYGLVLLAYCKLLLSRFQAAIKAVIKFALEKPLQFLAILLSLALLWAGWYGYQTKTQLTATQKIVEEKVTFIKGQDIRMKEYVKALDTEKKNHVNDIKRGNDAVAGLKRTADAALARAQRAGEEARKDQVKFDKLGSDYGRSNPSTGKAADRIKREEATNDSFIKEWKKVSQ